MTDTAVEEDQLIDLYNAIVERESTIVDLRPHEQYMQKHILTAKAIRPTFIDLLSDMSYQRTIILCFQGEPPSAELTSYIRGLGNIELVVHVEFNRFEKEYPFLCTSGSINEEQALSQYPTRLFHALYCVFSNSFSFSQRFYQICSYHRNTVLKI